MKRALILSATCLAFAACSGPDEAGEASGNDKPATETAGTSFENDCLVVANDAEGKEEIADKGTDPEGFCNCATQFLAEMPEDEQEKARATMSNVAAGMQETGEATETVVGQMMSDAMAKGEDPEAQATAEGIRIVGRMIDNIGTSFDETGSCTVG